MYAGALKAEALVPFLSTFIKGAAAASDATSGSSEAPSGDATEEEPSAETSADGKINDTAGERAEAPQVAMPDLYDLDLEKVDTLLDEDSVWLIATYTGAPADATGCLICARAFAVDHRVAGMTSVLQSSLQLLEHDERAAGYAKNPSFSVV